MLLRSALLAAVLFAAGLPAFAAGPLTGIVTDGTTGKPAAGDTVSLIGFGQGMQVAAHTATDAHGRFTLQVPDESMHLVRVDHEKATYFEPAPPGTHSVKVTVYDVAAKVKGVVTEADVLSMQTEASGLLHVTEDFFVHNSSKPPMTQFSNHAYEFFLPPGAKLEGTAAMGPGGMPVESTPVPLAGEGHYAFLFPVRPGETRFQVSYTVPYKGKLVWNQREAIEAENLVVMLPKSMQFAAQGTNWQPVQQSNIDAQVFVQKDVAPLTPVAFSVSGDGALPRDAQAPGQPGAGSAPEGRPGGGLGPPIDTPDPLHRYKGWLLALLGVLLLGGAWWLMRGKPAEPASDTPEEKLPPALRPTVRPAAPGTPPQEFARPLPSRRSFRQSLEESLLTLERDYALGLIGEPEVAENRSTLQRMLHRILAREAQKEAEGAKQSDGPSPLDRHIEDAAGYDPDRSRR
jgi:5-hydroxyisourate hydrolase-like protein (transthyretin family)